jgi:mediator of RNA polymerase II transcription subunit 25
MEEKTEETQDTKPNSTLWQQSEPAEHDNWWQVQCEIFSSISKNTNEIEVKRDSWPARLIIQLTLRAMITSVGRHLLQVSWRKSLGFDDFLTDFWFQDAKIMNFQWDPLSDSFESLSKVMLNGFAGCMHFTPAQFDTKILILLYMTEKKSYYGFIPNDQNGYVDRLRRVIQQMGQNPVPV